jgi:signal transduction histidine kinase
MTGSPPAGHTAPRSALRRAWPYAVVLMTGAVLWFLVWGFRLPELSAEVDDDVVGLTGALMLIDLLAGAASVLVLPLRRRAPLAAAIPATVMTTVSSAALAAAVLAVVRAARAGIGRGGLAVLGAVWTAAVFGNEALAAPAVGTVSGPVEVGVLGLVALLFYLILVGIGRYRRSRAEALELLRERAEHAEQRRERAVRDAREAERLRIAREMHDVLAHRMSLVSMHAGALTYREDLPREAVARAAHVIQDTTGVALRELRELLGVLREEGEDDAARPRAPQPTLERLPALLAEARASGTPVAVRFEGIEAEEESPRVEGLEASRSRTAYRIAQEALTNVRKHAPGQRLDLRIARGEGRLTVEARNRLPPAPPAAPSSGMGLVGLAERVRLAGGDAASECGVEQFVLRAWVPWT